MRGLENGQKGFNMKEIYFIQRYGTGFLAKGMSDNGQNVDIQLIEIRAAVIPPQDVYPGYYLFLGMLKKPNTYLKYPLLFLHEKTVETFHGILEDISDDASRLKASIIYTPIPTEKRAVQGFYKDLWDYRYRNNLPYRVKPAISVKDYRYGDALIREWRKEKALILPIFVDTILKNQLFTDHGMDIDSNLKDPKWFCFHALRILLAGFVKEPPKTIMQQSSTGWGDRYDSENILSYQKSNNRSLKAWT